MFTPLVGLFVRRILLKYKMMTFEQIAQLGKRLAMYVQQAGSDFIDKSTDSSTAEDVTMEDDSECIKEDSV